MEPILRWLSDNKDLVQPLSSLLAIIIGFLSIILTFWTLLTNRRHQRLTLRPIADISTEDFENKSSVKIENKGNGPLIINAFRAIKGTDSKADLIDWMPELPDNLYWSDFHKHIEGSALRPSGSLALVEFKLDKSNAKQREARDNIRRTLEIIDGELDYSDIYEKPMHYPRHSLSWFGRNL